MKQLYVTLKRLFCKHNYEQIDFIESYDPIRNIRYSIRIYKCSKCGKELEFDMRYDIHN